MNIYKYKFQIKRKKTTNGIVIKKIYKERQCTKNSKSNFAAILQPILMIAGNHERHRDIEWRRHNPREDELSEQLLRIEGRLIDCRG